MGDVLSLSGANVIRRFNRLEFSGIKGQRGLFDLSPVTIFAGPNRSGKSAAMDAARLAATCNSSAGKSVELQKKLRSSDVAYAILTGVDLKCKWSITDKRKWEADGSFKSDLPATVEDFWGLTGEERWQLIEQAVGKFSEEPPPPSSEIADQIKSLRSIAPVDPYSGPSLAELTAEEENLRSFLDEQAELSRNIAYRKKRVEDMEARLPQLESLLAETIHEIGACESLLDQLKEMHKNMEAELSSLAKSDLIDLRKYGSTSHEIIAAIEKERFRVHSRVYSFAGNCPRVTEEEFEGYVKNALAEYADLPIPSPDTSKFSQACKVECRTILECEDQCDTMSAKIASTAKMLTTLIERRDATAKNINDIKKNAASDRADFAKVLSPAVIAAKSAESVLIRGNIEKCKSYMEWSTKTRGVGAKLIKLEEDLANRKQAESNYKKLRAKYIEDSIGPITDIANEILDGMELPRISIDLSVRGYRSSITITNAIGVDINTMAGSEKIVYGFVTLYAMLARLSDLPIVWVECAELDGLLFDRFVFSVASVKHKRSIPGNVFLAHWAGLQESVGGVNQIIPTPS